MASAKKTTSNFIWLFLIAVLVLVLPKFFFAQTESLQIMVTARPGGCEKAEFFAGLTIPNKLPKYTHAVFPLYQPTNKPDIFTASDVLKKPFKVLRIDPCTRAGETVEILEIKLSGTKKTTLLNLADLAIECTNCELKISPDHTLIVKSLNGDPQLFFKNLDSKLFDYSNPLLVLYQIFFKLALLVVFILIGLFFIALIGQNKCREVLVFLVSNLIAAIAFYLLYKKRFGLGKNLPFGNDIFQTGMAYVHLNLYSRYTDDVLYLIPLIISAGLIIAGIWYLRRHK